MRPEEYRALHGQSRSRARRNRKKRLNRMLHERAAQDDPVALAQMATSGTRRGQNIEHDTLDQGAGKYLELSHVPVSPEPTLAAWSNPRLLPVLPTLRELRPKNIRSTQDTLDCLPGSFERPGSSRARHARRR